MRWDSDKKLKYKHMDKELNPKDKKYLYMHHNIDITLTKKISLHLAEESLFYFIPTIGFQKLDWGEIYKENVITYLFVIKWLKWSASINIRKENRKYE